jgi:hypothetical protein
MIKPFSFLPRWLEKLDNWLCSLPRVIQSSIMVGYIVMLAMGFLIIAIPVAGLIIGLIATFIETVWCDVAGPIWDWTWNMTYWEKECAS